MTERFEIPKATLRKMYYEEGMTQAEIAARLGCRQGVVQLRMKEHGLETRTANDYRRTEIPRDELYHLYVELEMSAKVIAACLGCAKPTVLRRLRAYHIPIRPSSRPWAQHVPPEVYASWSADLAWAVGLFASDGGLHRGDNGIRLCSTDWELMENFMGCIQLDPAIEPRRQPATANWKTLYRLDFFDVGFRTFLESLGLTPNKSLTLCPLAIPNEFFPDYARGAWDGDGTWTIRRKTQKSGKVNECLCVSLSSSSPAYLEWMQAKIEQLAGLYGGVYDVNLVYTGSKAIALGRWLYYAPNLPALSRKREIWERFAKQPSVVK